VDDVDVWFAVVPLVRAVDAVMLQPLDMRLQVAQNTTLEHDCLTNLHRRIARSLGDDWLVGVYGYRKILIIIHWRICRDLNFSANTHYSYEF